MLLAVLTVSLLAADPPAPSPEENGAKVEHLDPNQEQPQESPAVVGPSAANDSRSAALREPTRRKSTSFILAGIDFAAGAVAGYLGLVVGIALNVPHGGLSSPPDSNDILLLGVIPVVACAAIAWLAGLFDFSQRSIIGSALWSVLGSLAGELVGVGAGLLVGNAMFPDDQASAYLVALAFGPAVAALGAVIFMEIFKPGEEVYATIDAVRTRNGSLALGPAFLMRF
jgi:hypothetical protein